MQNRISVNTTELEALINERIKLINALYGNITEELNSLPTGKLHVSKRGNYRVFYKRNASADKTGIYIPKKNHKEAVGLAQREYDEKLLKEIERQLYHLKQLKRNHLENVITTISENKRDLIESKIVVNEEYMKIWQEIEYNTRSFEGITTEYYTDNDERVRSKSEILIANTLKRMGVPYRYEYPQEVQGLGNYHPDFTCLNIRLQREVIWEHFGRMTDEGYVENMVNKLNRLTLAGYKLGKDYIFTTETEKTPLNTRVVERMIIDFLK